MFMACRNQSGLRECYNSLDGTSREEFKIFKAICRSLDYDEVRSFYGIYVSNEKVTAKADLVSIEGLHEKFPFTDSDIIKKVMDQQTSWTSCCDVLSSLVASHGTVLLESLRFSINDYDWPSVQESMLKRSCRNQQPSSDDLDWSIFELDDLNFNEDEHSRGETNQIEQDVLTKVGVEDDWELVQHSSTETESMGETGSMSISDILSRHASTYRDALMVPAVVILKKGARTAETKITQQDWRPRFQVVKVGRKRVDRAYGALQTVNRPYHDCRDEWIDDIFSSELEMYVRAPVHN